MGLAQDAGCPIADDGGSTLGRTSLGVISLAEIETWQRKTTKRSAVQYVLLVDAPVQRGNECHCLVEARAGGELWRPVYVTG